MILPHRTTSIRNFALVFFALVVTSIAALATDLYTGITESSTANFSVAGSTDSNGRIPVDANWNTTFIQSPPHPTPTASPTPTPTVTGAADVFHGAAGVSYDLNIGPNADLFNVGNADDGKDQFNFRPSTDAFLLLMDGASSTSRSVINNYGSIGTTYYNPNYPNPASGGPSASDVAYIQNTDFYNYGTIGYADNSNSNANYLSALAVQLGPNSSFTNYGTVHSSNGIYEPTASQSPISGVQENNYGLIFTKGGAALEGNGIINNFSTGALEDATNGSYGFQMYQGASASNWGMISIFTDAVWMAQSQSTFDDYGGPLFPGAYLKVPAPGYSGYANGCALAFHGGLGNAYDGVSVGSIEKPTAGDGGSVGIAYINSGYQNTFTLHSTVYTIASTTPNNVTPAGTRLLYLPIVTGAIWASDHNDVSNNSKVVLDFEGITSHDRGLISAAVNPASATNKYSIYETKYGAATFTAVLNAGGATYSLTNVRNVTLMDSTKVPIPTDYPVGVYSGSPSAPASYPASLLVNPVTLRLTDSGGSSAALAAGTTYVEAGCVLQFGAMSFDDAHSTTGGQDNRYRNGALNYSGSPGACTAIYIDSGMATAVGFNIDGVTQTSQSAKLSLPGTLVVDNQYIEADPTGKTGRSASNFTTTLPPLQGSGQFVQQGTGTTILTGLNTFSGPIFIPRGTLKFATGATLPNVGGVVMDASSSAYEATGTFDLSAGTPPTNVSGSSLGRGFVFPYLKVIENPDQEPAYNNLVGTIKLGANNLIIGNPAAGAARANSSSMGQLTGTGALEVAGNTTLRWGGSIASYNSYSGGTVIDPGAVVQVSTFPHYQGSTVQPYYMFGSGNLTNNGTLETVGGRPQVGTWGTVPGQSPYVQTVVNATDSGGNHVIYVNGNYTQGSGGTLVLNVNSTLLVSGTPAAPGVASDYLNVGGTLTLNSKAYLTLNDLQPTALTQPATIVIAQAGSGTLGGANLFTSGTTGVPLYEGTIFQVGLNSAVIHYGTLSGYAGAITLTLFPTGFDSWASTDIGAVGTAGSASYLNGAYTVSGSGADIWNSVDAFQFVEQPMVGDGAISARVTSVQNTSGWAKAGVMIRDSLTPGAPYFAAFMTPGFGLTIQWRTASGGSLNNVTPAVTAPNWVKVARADNTFSAYQSKDGVNWAQIKDASARPLTITVNMGSAASAGLAVTSHNNAALCTAGFDNVNLLPGAEWSAADIGAPGLAGFTSYSDGLLSVAAGGTNLWGTSDQFRFVYQPVSGDCDISARIGDVSDTNPKAKAGLMIRETLASNSPHYFLFATPEQGVFLQSRADPAGSSSVYLKQSPTLATPLWLRLKRSGSTLTAYTSTDGINWTAFDTITNLTLSANAYVGLALLGSNATTLGAAEFDSISVSP